MAKIHSHFLSMARPVFKRYMATFLFIAFTLTNLSIELIFSTQNVYAESLSGSNLPRHGSSQAILDQLALPEEFGTVLETVSVKDSNRLILYVQDAHTNLDAARNIQNIIQYFQENFGLSLVLLEGGDGKLDSLFFKSFPDSNIKTAVLNRYLENGELTGAESAAILDESNQTEYFGIENQSLYEANKKAFLRAHEVKEEILSKLELIESNLQPDIEKLSKRSQAFYRHQQNFKSEKTHLLEYLQALRKLTPERDWKKDYVELDKLIQIEKKSHEARTEQSEAVLKTVVERFESEILPRMSPTQQIQAGSWLQLYRVGHIEEGILLQHLKSTAHTVGIDFKIPESLQILLDDAKTLQSIQGTELFEELTRLEANLREILPASDSEKELLEQLYQVDLLKRFTELEITHQEWQTLQLNIFETKGLSSDIFDAHKEFYKLAVQRDQALFENAVRRMNEKDVEVALMVTGGFHTNGITKKIKDDHTSLILMMPKIQSVSDSERYLRMMKDEASYMRYFNGSYWDALVKDYSVKIAQSLKPHEQIRAIKVWRDRLIQNALMEERIEESGNYTRYVDAILQGIHAQPEGDSGAGIEHSLNEFLSSYLDQAQSDAYAKLNVFLNGLKDLWSNGNMTPQSVQQIFKNMNAVSSAKLGTRIALINDTSNLHRTAIRSEIRTEEELGPEWFETPTEVKVRSASTEEEISIENQFEEFERKVAIFKGAVEREEKAVTGAMKILLAGELPRLSAQVELINARRKSKDFAPLFDAEDLENLEEFVELLNISESTRSEVRTAQARENLIGLAQPLVDLLQEADDFSSQSPNVYVIPGSPDLKVLLEFAKQWKEEGGNIPIFLSGGRGRGTSPLALRIMNHYWSQGILSAEEGDFLGSVVDNREYEGEFKFETHLMDFVLQQEGIPAEMIYAEKIPSRNTRMNYETSQSVLERHFANEGITEPVIAIVASPPLLARVKPTAENVWHSEHPNWQVKRYRAYDLKLSELTNEELIERMGYLTGYPQKYAQQFPQISTGNELKGFRDQAGDPFTPEDLQYIEGIQHAFEALLDTYSQLEFDEPMNTLIPVRSELRTEDAAQKEPLKDITDVGTVGTRLKDYYERHTKRRLEEGIVINQKFVSLRYRDGSLTITAKGENADDIGLGLMEKTLTINKSKRLQDFLEANKEKLDNLHIYLLEPHDGNRTPRHPHLLTTVGRDFQVAFSGTNNGTEKAVYLTRQAFVDLDTRLLTDILTNQIEIAVARYDAWHRQAPFQIGQYSEKMHKLLERIRNNDLIKNELNQVHRYDMAEGRKYAIDKAKANQVVKVWEEIKNLMPDFAPAHTNHKRAIEFEKAVEKFDFNTALKWWGLIMFEYNDLIEQARDPSMPIHAHAQTLILPDGLLEQSSFFYGLSAEINEEFNKYILDHGVYNQEGEEYGKVVGRVIVVEDINTIGELFKQVDEKEKKDLIWVFPYLPARYDEIPGGGIVMSVGGNRHAIDAAKEQSIPLAVIPDAVELLKDFNGQRGMLRVERDRDVRFRLAHEGERGLPRKPPGLSATVPKARVDGKLSYRLSEIDENYVYFVGPKAASLAQMMSSGVTVPDGFVLPFRFWSRFQEHNEIENLSNEAMELSLEDDGQLLEEMRYKIINGEFPEDLIEEVKKQVSFFRSEYEMGEVDFDLLLRYIKQVFASKYNEKPVRARLRFKVKDEDVKPAVLIQVPKDAKFAGTMYTADPVSEDQNMTAIFASHGQGAAVVGETGRPARVEINKITNDIHATQRHSVIDGKYELLHTDFFYVRSTYNFEDLVEIRTAGFYDSYPDRGDQGGPIEIIEVTPEERELEIISDELAVELSRDGQKVEEVYDYRPQDIEWVLDEEGKRWMVQSRPMKTDARHSEHMLDTEKINILGLISFERLEELRQARMNGDLSVLIEALQFPKAPFEVMMNPAIYAERVIAGKYLSELADDQEVVNRIDLESISVIYDYFYSDSEDSSLRDAFASRDIIAFLQKLAKRTQNKELKDALEKYFLKLATMGTQHNTHTINFEIAKGLVTFEQYKAAVSKLREAKNTVGLPDIGDRVIRILDQIPLEYSRPALEAFAENRDLPTWINEYAMRVIDRREKKEAESNEARSEVRQADPSQGPEGKIEIRQLDTWTDVLKALERIATEGDVGDHLREIRQLNLWLRHKTGMQLNRTRDFNQYPDDLASDARRWAVKIIERAHPNIQRPIKELVLGLPYAFVKMHQDIDLRTALWGIAEDLDERTLRTRVAGEIRENLHGASFSEDILVMVSDYLKYLRTGNEREFQSKHRIVIQEDDRELHESVKGLTPKERNENYNYKSLTQLRDALTMLFKGTASQEIFRQWVRQPVVKKDETLLEAIREVNKTSGKKKPHDKIQTLITARQRIHRLLKIKKISAEEKFDLYHLDQSLGQQLSMVLPNLYKSWDADKKNIVLEVTHLIQELLRDLYLNGFVSRYTSGWANLLSDPELTNGQLKDLLRQIQIDMNKEFQRWMGHYFDLGLELFNHDYKRADQVIATLRKEKFTAMAGISVLEKVQKVVARASEECSDCYVDPKRADQAVAARQKDPFGNIVHIDNYTDEGHRYRSYERTMYGGKATSLMRMNSLGMPVPSGFIIPAKIPQGNWHMKNRDEFHKHIDRNLEILEENWSKKIGRQVKFGDPKSPLFLAVRSGSTFIMPGIFDTGINLGLTPEVFKAEVERRGKRAAYSAYVNFIQSIGRLLDISEEEFEHTIERFKVAIGKPIRPNFTADELENLADSLISVIQSNGVHEEFEALYNDPKMQLYLMIDRIFDSWDSAKAIQYRSEQDISDFWHTPVTVQAYVFGDYDDQSGTGIALSHNRFTEIPQFGGEWISGTQGVDHVEGRISPHFIATMQESIPEAYETLKDATMKLSDYFGVPILIEFTVENGRLHLLQAIQDLSIGENESFPDLDWEGSEASAVGQGLAAYGKSGALRGVVVHYAEDATRQDILDAVVSNPDIDGIFVVNRSPKPADTPDLIMTNKVLKANGKRLILLTETGGLTSHAAMVANSERIPTLLSVDALKIDEEQNIFLAEEPLQEMDPLTVEFKFGKIYRGILPIKKRSELRIGDSRDFSVESIVTISSERGVHGRPTEVIATMAEDIYNRFEIQIKLTNQESGNTANAQVMIEVYALGMQNGTEVKVTAEFNAEEERNRAEEVLDVFSRFLADGNAIEQVYEEGKDYSKDKEYVRELDQIEGIRWRPGEKPEFRAEIRKAEDEVLLAEDPVEITTQYGIHNKPSFILSEIAERIHDLFGVRLEIEDIETQLKINPRNTFHIISLGLAEGSKLEVRAYGQESQEETAEIILALYVELLQDEDALEKVGHKDLTYWERLNDIKRSIARSELRLDGVAETSVISELIKILNLPSAETVFVGKTLEGFEGYEIQRIRIPERTDLKAPPKTGLEVLHNELAPVREFDLLLTPENELIAIFPAPTPEFMGRVPETAALTHHKYFDFTNYLFNIPRVGEISNRDAEAAWAELTSSISKHQSAIHAYKHAAGFDKKIEPNRVLDRVVRYYEFGQAPYVYAEVNQKTGAITLEQFDPDEYDAQKYNVKKPNLDQIIFPVFPTIYSPAHPKHWGVDKDYYRSILTELRFQPDHEVLVGFAGSGFDTWLASLGINNRTSETGKKIYAFDINPFAIANIRTVAELAGFEVDARLSDNLINETGQPLFEEMTFDRILGNMPMTFIPANPTDEAYPRLSLVKYWDLDRGSVIRRFAKGITRLLNRNGLVLIWNDLGIRQESLSPVAEILKSAGTMDFKTGIAETPNVLNVETVAQSTNESGMQQYGVYKIQWPERSELRNTFKTDSLETYKEFIDKRPVTEQAFRDGVVFTPTPLHAIPNIFEAVRQHLAPYEPNWKEMTLYEIGSGKDLRVSLFASSVLNMKKVKAVESKGDIHQQASMVLKDAEKFELVEKGRVELILGDALDDKHWVPEADIVFFYYTQPIGEEGSIFKRRLYDAILNQMKPGSVFVLAYTESQRQYIRDFLVNRSTRISDEKDGIYAHVYQVPARSELRDASEFLGNKLADRILKDLGLIEEAVADSDIIEAVQSLNPFVTRPAFAEEAIGVIRTAAQSRLQNAFASRSEIRDIPVQTDLMDPIVDIINSINEPLLIEYRLSTEELEESLQPNDLLQKLVESATHLVTANKNIGVRLHFAAGIPTNLPTFKDFKSRDAFRFMVTGNQVTFYHRGQENISFLNGDPSVTVSRFLGAIEGDGDQFDASKFADDESLISLQGENRHHIPSELLIAAVISQTAAEISEKLVTAIQVGTKRIIRVRNAEVLSGIYPVLVNLALQARSEARIAQAA